MKRIYIFLLLCAATLFASSRAAAQCTTLAGTLNSGNATVCVPTTYQLPYLNNAVLDSTDVLAFVVHNGTATQLGTILWWSTPGVLVLPPGSLLPGTYQVAVVAGNSLGNGQIDLTDPCLSFDGGFTINVLPAAAVTATASNSLSCSTPTATLSVTIDPPGTYQYYWSGPNGFGSSQPSPVIAAPGTYWVSVFGGGANCATGATVTVAQIDSLAVSIAPVGFDCTTGALPGTLGANVTGAAGALTYAWSNGATTPTIAISAAGSYCVTVTDAGAGCTRSACYQVFPNPPLTVELVYESLVPCVDSVNGLFVNVNGGGVTTTILWNNGYTWNYLPSPAPGLYSVTVTNPLGCTATAGYFVESSPLDECGYVQGTVYIDYNNNCVFDAGDVGLDQQIVEFAGLTGNDYAYSWQGGAYATGLTSGTYEVSVSSAGALFQPCQPSYTINVGIADTVTLNLPLQPVELCPVLTVDLYSNFLRRCFSSTYYVHYSNTGSATANDAYVDVTLDGFLSFQSAPVPFTNLGNNVIRFEVGDVPVNGTGNFSFTVLVGCDATLGQTHCTTAEIFPHDPCPSASAQWSGASIELMAECAGDSLQFYLVNNGAPTTAALGYVVIEDAIMRGSGVLPSGFSGQMAVPVPANGSTWRMEAEQEPFHPGASMPSLSVEGCTTNGVFSLGFVGQFALNDEDPWIDEDCTENVGAYDPNDKQGFPTGYSAAHYIRPETEIEYAIRFQNTGTDTAFTVVVRDTLSPWLDRGSVVPGPASHPYRFEFYGDGLIKFTFENIALPDSNVDVAGSQGFVSFRVKPRASTPLETDLLNSAAIYFDFNEPVITNTTVHRVGDNFITTATWQPIRAGLDLRVAPHPVADRAVLTLTGIDAASTWQLSLTDPLGRTVRQVEVNGPQWTLERGTLPAGLYTAVVRQGGMVLGTAKLVLR